VCAQYTNLLSEYLSILHVILLFKNGFQHACFLRTAKMIIGLLPSVLCASEAWSSTLKKHKLKVSEDRALRKVP
jgi:hypothetical protein